MELNETFLEFPITVTDFTGTVEHTELTDVDRSVATFFQSLLSALVVSDTTRRENQEFARFVKRKGNTKIYAGDFDSPNDFLTKLTSKLGDKVKSERNELLPVCYISRDPAIVFADGSDYIDLSGHLELFNEAGEKYALVNKSYVNLTYTITAMAWNKSTLSRMLLGIMMYLRHTKRGRKHVFTAETMIAGCPIALNIELKGMKEAMTTPSEVDHQQQRLFASSVTFEVTAEVLEAEAISEMQGRIGLLGGILE